MEILLTFDIINSTDLLEYENIYENFNYLNKSNRLYVNEREDSLILINRNIMSSYLRYNYKENIKTFLNVYENDDSIIIEILFYNGRIPFKYIKSEKLIRYISDKILISNEGRIYKRDVNCDIQANIIFENNYNLIENEFKYNKSRR